jgi:malonyl-CoA O-methyltransferase
MDMETLTVTYESPENLLREVQAFGGLRRPGGRAAWQAVVSGRAGRARSST